MSTIIIDIPEREQFVSDKLVVPCTIDGEEVVAKVFLKNAGRKIALPKADPDNPYRTKTTVSDLPSLFIIEIDGYINTVHSGHFGETTTIKMVKSPT